MRLEHLIVFFIIPFLVFSCEETDTNPPDVIITYPVDQSTVSEIVTILCTAEDNEGIKKLELLLDGSSTGLISSTQPYSIEWNTTQYPENMVYSLEVKAYDLSNNSSLSNRVHVSISQTEALPTPAVLNPFEISDDSYTISWDQNLDSDFYSYELFESLNSEMSDSSLVFSSTSVTETSHTFDALLTDEYRYYKLITNDQFGLRSASNTIVYYVSSTFQVTFGGSDTDFAESLDQTTDGGFIVLGSLSSWGMGMFDFWLVKTDALGGFEWSRNYGGSDIDNGRQVLETRDGGFILIGDTESFGNGDQDMRVIKTDSNGNVSWSRNFGGSGWDTGYSIIETPEGDLVMAGSKSASQYGDGNLLLVKTSSNGDLIWEKTIGTAYHDAGKSLQQTSDGGYIITGYSWASGSGFDRDIWLVKTDAMGELVWQNRFGGNYWDEGRSVREIPQGGFILTGYVNLAAGGPRDLILIKTDPDGNEIWTKTFGGAGSDEGYSVQLTTDGNYIITGYTVSYSTGGASDLWLIKTDTGGNEIWSKTYGGASGEFGNSIQQLPDGGYIIAGSTSSFGNGNSDVWLIRTDESGDIFN